MDFSEFDNKNCRMDADSGKFYSTVIKKCPPAKLYDGPTEVRFGPINSAGFYSRFLPFITLKDKQNGT